MRKLLTLLVILALCLPAYAAQNTLVTQPRSLLIVTGNTYQLLLASTNQYNSLTIQNNNATDACFIEVSGLVAVGATTATVVAPTNPLSQTVTAQQASMILGASGSYVRYYPYLPRGPIVVTCATAGDSVYVDTQ